MAYFASHWRVYAASILSVAFVFGAYLLAKNGAHPPLAEASTEAALLQAIASKDADADGLPDWEEALYATSPTIADTNHLGMTDGEAVAKGLVVPRAIADIPMATSSPVSIGEYGLPPSPDDSTLTAAFAKNFFTTYLSAKQANGGVDLSPADTDKVVTEALDTLSAAISVAPDYKSAKDLVVAGSGEEALKVFAVAAEAVFNKNRTDATMSEISYLTNAIQNNDTSALTQLAKIAKATRDIAVGLSVLPVPQELAAGDLMLINAMMRMSEIIENFAHLNDDSLATMIALQQYVPAAQMLGDSFVNISNVYTAMGVTFPNNALGAWFANIANLVGQQKKP